VTSSGMLLGCVEVSMIYWFPWNLTYDFGAFSIVPTCGIRRAMVCLMPTIFWHNGIFKLEWTLE
jgi:hypothetical protein